MAQDILQQKLNLLHKKVNRMYLRDIIRLSRNNRQPILSNLFIGIIVSLINPRIPLSPTNLFFKEGDCDELIFCDNRYGEHSYKNANAKDYNKTVVILSMDNPVINSSSYGLEAQIFFSTVKIISQENNTIYKSLSIFFIFKMKERSSVNFFRI